MTPVVQRLVGGLVLLVTGMLSLPAAAYVLDDRRTENWILPAQLLVMAAIGAAVASALPAMAGREASTSQRAFTGAGWGLVAALVGALVFWFLLSGLRGA